MWVWHSNKEIIVVKFWPPFFLNIFPFLSWSILFIFTSFYIHFFLNIFPFLSWSILFIFTSIYIHFITHSTSDKKYTSFLYKGRCATENDRDMNHSITIQDDILKFMQYKYIFSLSHSTTNNGMIYILLHNY